ncbi:MULTISPECIES: tyrosine-type recombinase/integrase [unclassified Adlercreutzia]|uniref:tyrosine-type recombinase/integrase n=1 Tax=unclassified Adlercreutzia TaxID=2636013 RepID=UPI0013EBF521|nr:MULTISPECIES: tyrosine-type recombinase/integrase [unclassified Adlercreutzia]
MSRRIEILTDPEIRKLKRGGYSVRFRIPPHHGLPESKSPRRKLQVRSIGAARKEAENYRRELEDEINDYRNITNITFGDYLKRWHEDRVEMGERAIGTLEVEELYIRQIDETALARIELKEIDENDLDNFKKENKRLGRSNDRQDKLLKLVKQVLKHAEVRREIKHNPSGAVENIKRDIKDKRKALTREDQQRLIEALESEDITGKTVVVRIAFSTGFRRGECLGLQWGDIDFKKKTINLTRQLTSKGEYAPPKFGGSGVIPIGDGLVRYLRRWKEKTSRQFYRGGRVPKESPVCRNNNGKQLQAANFDKWRRDWFVEHGLGEYTEIRVSWDSKGRKRYHKTGYKGYRLHELRHTMATELVGNADLKTAQTIMRHTNINTTAGYVHEIDENVRNAANLLDDMRESGSEPKRKEDQVAKDEKRFKEDRIGAMERAYKRQHGKCAECGKRFEKSEMVGGFITSLSKDGIQTTGNFQLLCKDCNMKMAVR